MRRILRLLVAAFALGVAYPAVAQDYPCTFQSHEVDPPHPAAFQPFTVTVAALASCFWLNPPETASSVVTVQAECWCAIGTPPPPYLQTETFQHTGLPPGMATVQFLNFEVSPTIPVYSFDLTIGSPLDVPAVPRAGLVLLALLLALSAIVSLKWRRNRPVA